MTSGDVHSKRPAPDETWLAATTLSDPNAALWHSLRPTGRRSWQASLRRHIESLSPHNPLRQLLPSSLQSGLVAPRWLFVGALTLCAGVGLTIFGREATPPVHEPASLPAANATELRLGATEVAVVPAAAPRAVAPVLAEATLVHALSPDDPALGSSAPAAKAKSASSAKKKSRALSKRRAAKSRRSSGTATPLP